MRSSVDIKAEMNQLSAELDTIIELATREQRELTPAEKKRVDELQGSFNGAKGLLQNLLEEHDRAVRFESRISEKMGEASSRFNGGGATAGGGVKLTAANGQSIRLYGKGERLAGGVAIPHALGQFCVGWAGGKRHIHPEIKAALSGGNNTYGGAVVPNGFSTEVIDMARAQARVLEAGGRVFTMDSGQHSMGKLTESVTIELKRENETFSEGSMRFTELMLVSRTFGAYIEASREFIEDAANAADLIESELSRQLATALDYWAINGDDTQNIHGILNNPDIPSTGSVGAIAWEDMSAAATAVRVANHMPGAFMMHPSILEDLSLLTSGDGTNSAKTWLTAPPNIANKPMLDTTNCPTSSVITGDWSKLLWGIRTGATIEATTQAGDTFKKHQVAFKVTFRGDVLIVDPTAFYVLNGITT